MDIAAQILVIITSSILVIFLIVAIVLVVLVIKVTNKIKKVANSGEVIAQNIERATKGFSKASTPLFFINLVRGFTSGNKSGKKGKRK